MAPIRPGSTASSAARAAGVRSARGPPAPPRLDPRARLLGMRVAGRGERLFEQGGISRQTALLDRIERVVDRRDAFDMRREPRDQVGPVAAPVQRRDIVERVRGGRQAVGLLVVHHLQAMFDCAVKPVRRRPGHSRPPPNMACRTQRRERVERGGRAQCRIAAAVDELLDLREELDLANAAAARA
jgi:hypothetical protein